MPGYDPLGNIHTRHQQRLDLQGQIAASQAQNGYPAGGDGGGGCCGCVGAILLIFMLAVVIGTIGNIVAFVLHHTGH